MRRAPLCSRSLARGVRGSSESCHRLKQPKPWSCAAKSYCGDLAAVADELEAAGLAPADRLPPEFPGLRALTAAGIETFSDLRSLEDVSEIKGIGPKLARRIGESAA